MENKLPFDPNTVFYAHDLASGYQGVGRLLEQGQRPCALVAGSDEIAFGILQRLREQAIAVPPEMALVIMDNIPMAAYPPRP